MAGRRGERGEVMRRYYTVGDVWEKLEHGKFERATSHDPAVDAWAGCTWEESMGYIQNGWKEGAHIIGGLMINPEIRDAMRVKPVVGFKGSTVDMGRYMTGRPDCMRQMKSKYVPSPVVKIGVDMCVNGGIDQKRIMAVGKTVITLIESLRFAGIPAEIWSCIGNTMGGYTNDTRIKIQESNKPVDLSRLAYWIGHPGLLRRTVFGLWEQEANEVRDRFNTWDGRGYGYVDSDFAKGDFDEWAPSAQSSEGKLAGWAKEVISRRVAGRHLHA